MADPVTLGSINSGGTPIIADLTNIHPEALSRVSLTTAYARATPPGYPEATPAGAAESVLIPATGTIASGTVLTLLQPEAAALVLAGGAAYV